MDIGVYSGLSLRWHSILAHHSLPRQSQQDSEYSFEDYDTTEEQYTGQLALLHKEHMEYFFHGLFTTEDFMPETVQERGYCASVERGAGSGERGFWERRAGITVQVW
jgi:hypothetical protein